MVKTAAQELLTASDELTEEADKLTTAAALATFSPAVVTCVYNPLRYARSAYRRYLASYAQDGIDTAFLGMNPGPYGMVQTGIPFGDVLTVTDWLGITEGVTPPTHQHPARPVLGFSCTRREISGSRLWGLFIKRFGTPDRFFAEHFVLNYCPLAFLEDSGRNITPDKLHGPAMQSLLAACDRHLAAAMTALRPRWVVCLGAYAEKRARACLPQEQRVFRLLHPSPANPLANAGWAEKATADLTAAGIWE